MAPGLRTNIQGRNRGANRGEQHDDFEGLPVRQWRLDRHTIAPPPQQEVPEKNNKWSLELPHGMPKHSHLLPQYSQEILRTLRSGRFNKRRAPEDEDADVENVMEKPEKNEEGAVNVRAFAARLWKPIPRNIDGPEISHLAKRRKGTVVLPSKAALLESAVPTVTKVKVRKLDAAGNPYTQDVILTEGQTVDGEIISTSVVAAPVSTSAASRDVSANVNPLRRKPVAQRKKIKGPGRGRRKKLLRYASLKSDATTGDGARTEAFISAAESNGPRLESENPSSHGSPTIDDDDTDHEYEHDHDNGHEMKDDTTEQSSTRPSEPRLTHTSAAFKSDPTNGHNLVNLAIPTASRVEGSPLKNVIMASPLDSKPPEKGSLHAVVVNKSDAPVSPIGTTVAAVPATTTPTGASTQPAATPSGVTTPEENKQKPSSPSGCQKPAQAGLASTQQAQTPELWQPAAEPGTSPNKSGAGSTNTEDVTSPPTTSEPAVVLPAPSSSAEAPESFSPPPP